MNEATLDRPETSDALAELDWSTEIPSHRAPKPPAQSDISSESRIVMMPFRDRSIVFTEPPPEWAEVPIQKIRELGNLPENWDSYGARQVNPDCAVEAIHLVLSLLGPEVPPPLVVPTTGGGLQFEWHRGGVDLEIEIESAHSLQVSFVDRQTGEEHEESLTGDYGPLVPLLNRVH